MQSKIRHFFVSLATGPFQAMTPTLTRAQSCWTEPAAQRALAEWNGYFSSYLFMYHCSARCYDLGVKDLYERSKGNKANLPSDEEVVKEVQRSYIVPQRVGEQVPTSERSVSKENA